MYRTILAAVNSSKHSQQAVEEALAVASEHDATLHVLGVVDRQRHDEPGLGTGELVTIEAEDQYNEFLKGLKQRAQQADVVLECDVQHGVPHKCILEYADEIDADVIFLGQHGDHRTHIGGVGRRLVAESDREVRVVLPVD
jgi:nucleotide-binding universal stress UspA family protein